MHLPLLSERARALTTRPVCAQEILPEHFYLRNAAGLLQEGKLIPTLQSYLPTAQRNKPFTERDCKVVGSVLQWLGTGGGKCFMNDVTRRLRGRQSCRTCFQVEWSLQNQRLPGLNGGYGALELILNGEPNGLQFRGQMPSDPRFISPVSPRDVQVADAVIHWLSTPDGLKFTARTEEEISYAEHLAIREFHLGNNLDVLTC